MAKAATKQLTFLDQLEVRHDAFQAVEESGARQIRHELERTKIQALRTVEEGLQKIAVEGKLKTSSEAIRRAKGLAADVDSLVRRGFGTVDGKLLSLKEAAFQKGLQDFEIAAHSIPGAPSLGLGTSFEQIFPEAASAALTNPVMGVSATATWNGVIGGTQEKVQQTLLSAVLTGESIDDTMRVLSDAMDISAASAERIARTGLNAMYNDAHITVINANPDIFVGYRWLSALDDRTSAICIRLHGSFFALGTNPPGPPAHWNCRSIVQPVFRDPAIQAQMMTDTQRVTNYKVDGTAKKGFIRTSTSSEKWLRRQPQATQRKVLGSKTKAELFKAGKASMDDIVSPAMEVLTDDKLIRRMAALRPKDKSLQALAKSRGIRVPSKKTILAEDKALASKQPFVQPTEMPDPNAAPTVSLPEELKPVSAPGEKLDATLLRDEDLDFDRAIELSSEARNTYSAKLQATGNFDEMEQALFARAEEGLDVGQVVMRDAQGNITGAISWTVEEGEMTIRHLGAMKAPGSSGAELVRHAVEEAIEKGLTISFESTPGAEGFYLRLGFIRDAKISKIFHANPAQLKKIAKALGTSGRTSKVAAKALPKVSKAKKALAAKKPVPAPAAEPVADIARLRAELDKASAEVFEHARGSAGRARAVARTKEIRAQIAQARQPIPVPSRPAVPRMATQEAWEQSLTEAERTALKNWQTDDTGLVLRMRDLDERSSPTARRKYLERFYGDRPNAAVRVQRDLDTYEALNTALERAPFSDDVVYRGIDALPDHVFNDWKTASEITFDARASTSAAKDVAEEFATSEIGDNSVLLKIRSGHKGSALPKIRGINDLDAELEVILPARTKYRVVERKWTKIAGAPGDDAVRVLEITVEAVDKAEDVAKKAVTKVKPSVKTLANNANREWLGAQKTVNELEADLRDAIYDRKWTHGRAAYSEANSVVKDIVEELKDANKELRLARTARHKAVAKARKADIFLDPDGPAFIPDKYRAIGLDTTEITQAEFNVLKGEFDELLKAHLNALKSQPPMPRKLRRPFTSVKVVANQKERYAYEMNKRLQNNADSMARARWIEYRAEQELRGVVDLERLATTPVQTLKAFQKALVDRGSKGQFNGFKDDVIDQLRAGFKKGKMNSGVINAAEDNLRVIMDMMDASQFELLEVEKMTKIKWKILKQRAFANDVTNEVAGRLTVGPSTWAHEFSHHVEFRTGTQTTMTGWKDYQAFRFSDSYGSTGVDGEDGFLGAFFNNYVARDYADGFTEVNSMGVQALFDKKYARRMARKGTSHLHMLWAQFRGFARWK